VFGRAAAKGGFPSGPRIMLLCDMNIAQQLRNFRRQELIFSIYSIYRNVGIVQKYVEERSNLVSAEK
jgi:hypothetical protein